MTATGISPHFTNRGAQGLAVARFIYHVQDVSGVKLKKIVTVLKPLRKVTVTIAGKDMTTSTKIGDEAQSIITALASAP